MLYWKVDVLEELKKAGYSTYRIRKENILAQSTVTKINQGKGISWENLERICEILNCQPDYIIGNK